MNSQVTKLDDGQTFVVAASAPNKTHTHFISFSMLLLRGLYFCVCHQTNMVHSIKCLTSHLRALCCAAAHDPFVQRTASHIIQLCCVSHQWISPNDEAGAPRPLDGLTIRFRRCCTLDTISSGCACPKCANHRVRPSETASVTADFFAACSATRPRFGVYLSDWASLMRTQWRITWTLTCTHMNHTTYALSAFENFQRSGHYRWTVNMTR